MNEVYALHIGIGVAHLLTLKRALNRGPGLPHHIDGDGWNCWGEAVGDDVNDEHTLHVVIPLAYKKHARLTLGALTSVGVPLRPMGGYSKQDGILAVLTDADDWGCLDGREGDGYTRSWYSICPDPDCGRDHGDKISVTVENRKAVTRYPCGKLTTQDVHPDFAAWMGWASS